MHAQEQGVIHSFEHNRNGTIKFFPKSLSTSIKDVPMFAGDAITIRVTGTYHEFGNFVSTVASLPRIVTQHDVTMAPKGGGQVGGEDELIMNMVAKTYRYLEEDEIEAAAEAKKGKRR